MHQPYVRCESEVSEEQQKGKAVCKAMRQPHLNAARGDTNSQPADRSADQAQTGRQQNTERQNSFPQLSAALTRGRKAAGVNNRSSGC